MYDKKTLESSFTYHKPKGDQTERYEKIRATAKRFASLVMRSCPESAEATLALRKIEEAVMWANASIARNE